MSGTAESLGFAGSVTMAPHPTTRCFLWGLCLAVALLSARSASAAAPMCDEKGASAVAPSPILPVRDVKIDAGPPLGCDQPIPAVDAPVAPRAANGAAVVVDDGSREGWVPPGSTDFSASATVRCLAGAYNALPPSGGFRPGVFRPPRG